MTLAAEAAAEFKLNLKTVF